MIIEAGHRVKMKRVPEPGQNNLWFRHNDSDAVLVFLHGVLSDSGSCWLHKNKKNPDKNSYWPELIENDHRFKDIAIYLAGYYTSIDSSSYEIRNCADEVFNALQREDAEGRPSVLSKQKITFVCHSTGGIVARYLIEANQRIFEHKHVGLVLIASPSYGSSLANTLDWLAAFYNHKLGAQLQWGSWSLSELDDRFKDLVHKKRIPQLCGVEFYENHFILHRKWLPFLTRKLVVTKESAGRYFGAPKLLRNTDHFNSVKPDNVNHPAHEFLLDFLKENDLLMGSKPDAVQLAQQKQNLFKQFPIPRIADADPLRFLGVERASIGPDDLPPYIDRRRDGDIDIALSETRRVLIEGRSGVGKSRSAYEAVRRLDENSRVIVPRRPEDLPEILKLFRPTDIGPYADPDGSPQQGGIDLAAELAGQKVVLWLNDLERFASFVDDTELERFIAAGDRYIVCTLRTSQINRFQDGSIGQLADRFREVLNSFPIDAKVLFEANLTTDEAERAADLYPDVDLTLGFPSFVMSEELRNRLASCSVPAGEALVKATADWQYLHFGGVTEAQLQVLFPIYLRTVDRTIHPDAEQYGRGLDWALAPLERKGESMRHASLLRREPNKEPRFTVHDSIVEYTTSAGISPPRETVVYAIEQASAKHCNLLGITMYGRDRELSILAFRAAIERGEKSAAYWAALPHFVYRSDQQRQWLRDLFADLIATADWEAVTFGATALNETGGESQAAEYLLLALDSGYAPAGYELGKIFQAQGRSAEAEDAWRTAFDKHERDTAIRVLGSLGMSYMKNKQGHPAKLIFGILIEKDPEVPVHHLMYGHARLLLDEPRDAYKSFTDAIRLSVGHPETQDVLGEAFLARGDLLYRSGLHADARLDLIDAVERITDPERKKAINDFIAKMDSDVGK